MSQTNFKNGRPHRKTAFVQGQGSPCHHKVSCAGRLLQDHLLSNSWDKDLFGRPSTAKGKVLGSSPFCSTAQRRSPATWPPLVEIKLPICSQDKPNNLVWGCSPSGRSSKSRSGSFTSRLRVPRSPCWKPAVDRSCFALNWFPMKFCFNCTCPDKETLPRSSWNGALRPWVCMCKHHWISHSLVTPHLSVEHATRLGRTCCVPPWSRRQIQRELDIDKLDKDRKSQLVTNWVGCTQLAFRTFEIKANCTARQQVGSTWHEKLDSCFISNAFVAVLAQHRLHSQSICLRNLHPDPKETTCLNLSGKTTWSARPAWSSASHPRHLACMAPIGFLSTSTWQHLTLSGIYLTLNLLIISPSVLPWWGGDLPFCRQHGEAATKWWCSLSQNTTIWGGLSMSYMSGQPSGLQNDHKLGVSWRSYKMHRRYIKQNHQNESRGGTLSKTTKVNPEAHFGGFAYGTGWLSESRGGTLSKTTKVSAGTKSTPPLAPQPSGTISKNHQSESRGSLWWFCL